MVPLPVPQEDSHRRRKDLGPPEDWKNLTSKYLERLQQRKKSEFQGGSGSPGIKRVERRKGRGLPGVQR